MLMNFAAALVEKPPTKKRHLLYPPNFTLKAKRKPKKRDLPPTKQTILMRENIVNGNGEGGGNNKF